MNELMAVTLITVLAVVSPGADFAIITKHSYLYGKTIGILTAFGITLGVFIHVVYSLIAMTFLIVYTPYFIYFIQYIGAIYLFYIGYTTFFQKPIRDISNIDTINAYQALKYGFFTNVLNPKTTLFVMSIYTQVISTSTSEFILVGYGLLMALAHFLWFTLLSLVFSSIVVRQKMLEKQSIINRVIGIILAGLGLVLFGSKLYS